MIGDRCETQRNFDSVASGYEEAAVLEAEVGRRLLDRVGAARRVPRSILDGGCGTGRDAVLLRKLYARGRVTACDLSGAMVRLAARRRSPIRARGLKSGLGVQADMVQLPFPERAFDLIFSNQALYWCPVLEDVLSEWRRILVNDGLVLLSTLGPGTWPEIRGALPQEPDFAGKFPNLQHVGDALLSAGFLDPVVDTETIEVTFRSPQQMWSDLRANGTLPLLAADAEQALQHWIELQGDGACALSYEVIYAMAFGPDEGQPRKTPEGDVATFSVDALRRTAGP